MATVTWVGGDGTGDEQTDSSRAANWSGGVPGSGDEVVIPNTTHECRLVTSYTWGSLEIEDSAEIDGNGKTITLDDGGVAAVFSNLGTITGILDIKCNGSTGRNIYDDGVGNIRNLEIDRSGVVFTLGFTLRLDGTLTITTGSELDTGSDRLFSVEGTSTIDGTLTANSSSVTFMDDVACSGEYSATDGTTVLYGNWRSAASRITHNGGTFKWATTAADGATIATNGNATATLGLNNVEISGSGITVNTNEWNLSIYGDLTITLGEYDTHGPSGGGTDFELTVTGKTEIGSGGAANAAKLTCNDSVCSFGAAYTGDYSLHVLQGGTFVGGGGAHTIGSFQPANHVDAIATLTDDVTTITSVYNGKCIATESSTTFDDANGTVEITTDTGGLVRIDMTGDPLYNLIINQATRTFTLKYGLVVDNDLTITAGTLDTGADLALTVTGSTLLTGTLTLNDSTVIFVDNLSGDGTLEAGTATVTAGNLYPALITADAATITCSDYFGVAANTALTISNGAQLAVFCRKPQLTTITALIPNWSVTINGDQAARELKVSSGEYHDLILNMTSDPTDVLTIAQDTTIGGNLTITSGVFNTGADKALTVTGDTAINGGTLTCNASAISLGSGRSVGTDGLAVGGSGTFTGGTGDHIIGSFYQSGGTVTFTNGDTTLNGKNTNSGSNFKMYAGTFNHGSGTIINTYTGATTINITVSTTQDINFNNYELDIGITRTLNVYNLGVKKIICAGTLTITSGDFDTSYTGHDDTDLTVTGVTTIGAGSGEDVATLTCNDSACSFGSGVTSNYGLIVEVGGTFVGGGGAHIMGSFKVAADNANAKATLTDDVTTIDSEVTGENKAFRIAGSYAGFDDGNGTVTFTCPETTLLQTSTKPLYNLIINNADAIIKIDGNLTVAQDLTITVGKLSNNTSGDTLTVDGDVSVTGTLECTDSQAYTFGSLTIADGGTYNATSGVTTINGNFDNNGTDPTTSFVHNDGTVVFNVTAGNIDVEASSTSTGTHFYNVKDNLTESTNIVNWSQTATIEKDWDVNSKTRIYGTMYFGTSTDTVGMTVDMGTRFQMYGGKLLGNSIIYPAVFTSGLASQGFAYCNTDDFELSNLDFSAFTTSTGVDEDKTITLEGDMKFGAVTVESGDELDIAGYRMECSGAFTNSGTTNAGGAGSMLIASYFTLNDTMTETNGTAFIVTDSTGGDDQNFNADTFDDNPLATIFINNGATSVDWKGSVDFEGKLIVGSTFRSQSSSANRSGDITVATGGTLNADNDIIYCSGDFTIAGGLIGKSALDFDGVDDYVDCGNDTSLDLVNAITLEVWINAEGSVNYPRIIAKQYNGESTNESCYQLGLREGAIAGPRFSVGGVFDIYSGSEAATTDNTDFGDMVDGKWHHLVGTYDKTDTKMYLDGKLIYHSTANTAVIRTSTEPLTLGAGEYDSTQSYLYDGVLGRASVWNVALTATQIRTSMFQNYTDVSKTGLVAWYQFNEGTGVDVADSTTTNEGTYNGAWVGAGTLTWDGGATPSAGTLNMVGPGTLTVPTATKLFNLTVGTTGQVTLAGSPYIYGLLTVDSNGITDGSINATIGIVNLTPVLHAGVNFSAISQIHYQTGGSAITIFPTTYDICRITASSQATLVGALGATTLQVDGSCSLTATGTTIQTRGFNLNGATTLDLGGTAVTLTDASPYGFINSGDVTTLTAGPGTSFIGHASKSKFESQNNWKVVGKCENLDVIDEELRVTGQVINCTGDIIQQHPSIDADQQLDYDTADDRDIHLGRDLDKNTELVT